MFSPVPIKWQQNLWVSLSQAAKCFALAGLLWLQQCSCHKVWVILELVGAPVVGITPVPGVLFQFGAISFFGGLLETSQPTIALSLLGVFVSWVSTGQVPNLTNMGKVWIFLWQNLRSLSSAFYFCDRSCWEQEGQIGTVGWEGLTFPGAFTWVLWGRGFTQTVIITKHGKYR